MFLKTIHKLLGMNSLMEVIVSALISAFREFKDNSFLFSTFQGFPNQEKMT